MHLSDGAIRQAFEAYTRCYVHGHGWQVSDRVRCWTHAAAAFDRGSFERFELLHGELKNQWQVFRGSHGPAPSPHETWEIMNALDRAWRERRLRDLSDTNVGECWTLINSAAAIKPMKSAPSVVAISKFLHFWGPRLFVIVDDGVMWRLVRSRSWLREPIESERKRLEALLPDAACTPSRSCDLLDYLAILSWSARLLRTNPFVTRHFGEYVRAADGKAAAGLPVEEHDGAAVEWLVLGLAELPPAGVELE